MKHGINKLCIENNKWNKMEVQGVVVIVRQVLKYPHWVGENMHELMSSTQVQT